MEFRRASCRFLPSALHDTLDQLLIFEKWVQEWFSVVSHLDALSKRPFIGSVGKGRRQVTHSRSCRQSGSSFAPHLPEWKCFLHLLWVLCPRLPCADWIFVSPSADPPAYYSFSTIYPTRPLSKWQPPWVCHVVGHPPASAAWPLRGVQCLQWALWPRQDESLLAGSSRECKHILIGTAATAACELQLGLPTTD